MLLLKVNPYKSFGENQFSRHLVLNIQKSCFPLCPPRGGEKEHESNGGRKRGEQKSRKASVNFWNSWLTAGNSLSMVRMRTSKVLVSHLSALFFMLWNFIWSCSHGSVYGKRERRWVLLSTVPCSQQILSGVNSILNGGLTWICPTVTF